MNEKPEPNWAFKIMEFIHNNRLRRKIVDPYKALRNAGLKSGQRILEVGCGPGFFTIPAANIVGETGLVYALDIHPLAIEKIKEIMTKEKILNIKPILASASEIGLEDGSVDLAFLFGIVHNINGFFLEVLDELHRIIRNDGTLSIKKSFRSKKKLVEAVEYKGFFFQSYNNGIFLFHNEK
ncbi:MAG: class I SAM-dependent methyltransferase [Candidatus Hodarchaeales archaeon]